MRLGIACDHRGFLMKESLKKYFDGKYDIVDYGTNSCDRVDYPKYGFLLGEKVRDKEVDCGIAICGSAIGISIACNKVNGVRCGKVNTVAEAIHARENDFVNVIALSGEALLDDNIKIIEAFLSSCENSSDPVYLDRVNQIIRYENER